MFEETPASVSVSLSVSSWLRRRTSSSDSAARSRTEAEVIMVTPERVEGGTFIASLLISTPMNANGAQPLTAQGIPQTATRKVATARERAKGAKIMVAANMQWEISQAIWRSGRIEVILFRKAAMPGGGRGVKRVRLLSGGRTQKGRTIELINVIEEKTTSERLPTRPTSPRMSFHWGEPLGTS